VLILSLAGALAAASGVPAGDATAGLKTFATAEIVRAFRPAAPSLQQDPAGRNKPGKKPKKKNKDKAAKAENPAPDEIQDPDDTQDTDETIDTVATGKGGARLEWKQHPSFRFGKVFRADIEAKFQEDAHASYPGALIAQSLNTFELHRNRVGIQGNFFKHIEYEIERELTERELTEKELQAGKQPKSHWKDVDVNVTYIKNAQIQVGKFKIPFGLDQLTGVTHNDFAYRSEGANYLAPARDIGAMVHGRFLTRGLNYWAGVFRHDGENSRTQKQTGADRTFAARVTGTPFRALDVAGIDGLDLGTAFTVSALSNPSFEANGLRGRTVMTQDTFYRSVYVQGRRRRWEGDVDWIFGPASARAEYTWVTEDRLQQGIGNEDLPDARARSWYVSGTWLLTGEEKTRPVHPAHDFLRGGIGAVELVGRYERMWFDSAGGTGEAFRNPRAENILPSSERALTLGVNWTLNRFLKLQLNAIREHVTDPERSPVPNGAFWSRVLRLQFVL